MKRLLKIILLTIISLMMFNKNVYALSNKDIDITKRGSITLNYNDILDDSVIRLYHIAFLNSNLEYQMNSNYYRFNLDINNIDNDNRLLYVIDELNTYIEDEKINEDIIKDIDNKKIVIDNLELGLYFIKTTNKNNTKTISSSLINIPNKDIDGLFDYGIEIFPKIDNNININSSPITLDNISIYIYLFIGSIIGIILLAILYKRYN